MTENKRDLSISMARVNVIVTFTCIPVFLVQFAVFTLTQNVSDIGLNF